MPMEEKMDATILTQQICPSQNCLQHLDLYVQGLPYRASGLKANERNCYDSAVIFELPTCTD